MAGSAAVVPGWPWIADAGGRTPDRHSASGTGRSRRVAPGAARRGQAGAWVARSALETGGPLERPGAQHAREGAPVVRGRVEGAGPLGALRGLLGGRRDR